MLVSFIDYHLTNIMISTLPYRREFLPFDICSLNRLPRTSCLCIELDLDGQALARISSQSSHLSFYLIEFNWASTDVSVRSNEIVHP